MDGDEKIIRTDTECMCYRERRTKLFVIAFHEPYAAAHVPSKFVKFHNAELTEPTKRTLRTFVVIIIRAVFAVVAGSFITVYSSFIKTSSRLLSSDRPRAQRYSRYVCVSYTHITPPPSPPSLRRPPKRRFTRLTVGNWRA